jgi:hypothetical protein
MLNLFGYTGVASLACAAAGAEVTHVDASKKSVAWARENAELSGLADKPIRWIVEDCRKYVAREVRRGVEIRRHHSRPAEIRARADRRGLAAVRGPARPAEGLRRPAVGRRLLPAAERLRRPHLGPVAVAS